MKHAGPSWGQELFFLLGIRSNFYRLMPAALREAERRGYRVGILDVVELVGGWRKYPNDWEAIGLNQHVIRPKNFKELVSFCLHHRHTKPIVVFLYLPDRNIRFVWRLFQVLGYRVGAMVAGPVPRVLNLNTEHGVQRNLTRLTLRMKRLLKPRPDFWITAGSACDQLYQSYFRTLDGVTRIEAHSIDYENRLDSERLTADNAGTPTVVVLDQGWFTKPRPDFLSNEEYPPATETVFGSAMRNFLAMIEDTRVYNVLVVCHPKADYEATRRLYEGFQVTNAPTPNVIRDAQVVLANSTTALQFAVLQRKPICLFTSDELDRSIARPLMEGYRNELQCPVVNIDRVDEAMVEDLTFEVNGEAYDRFTDRYIKHSDSPNRPLWEIVFDGIETVTVS